MEEIKDKKKVVFGLFGNRTALENAVDTLKMKGFMAQDISALLPSKEGTQDFAHEKATKAPEGATTGAVGGAALGGTLGWLVGIGALAIPGIGPFVAAGPILASLAGAGIGGTVGGVTGALVGYGIPEYEAKRYESAIREGGMLLSVHVQTDELLDLAKKVLKDSGARDISSSSEVKVDDDMPKKPLTAKPASDIPERRY
jgi:hypothetical protein